jgi:hypothetical protein
VTSQFRFNGMRDGGTLIEMIAQTMCERDEFCSIVVSNRLHLGSASERTRGRESRLANAQLMISSLRSSSFACTSPASRPSPAVYVSSPTSSLFSSGHCEKAPRELATLARRSTAWDKRDHLDSASSIKHLHLRKQELLIWLNNRDPLTALPICAETKSIMTVLARS